jgi:rhodanese-related sulfurtransferase
MLRGALVNVLSPEAFAKEHIPDSINIPQSEIDRFEEKFARDKEIIVYCASKECDASPKTANVLQEHGFTKVYDYAEGLKGWKNAGNSTAGAVSNAV